MDAELVPAAVFDGDEQRWTESVMLIGQWLMEGRGHTRASYADAIGWPYRPSGQWRGYHSTRHGLTWLGWCHTNGVHLFDAKRLHVLTWIGALELSRSDTGEPLSRRSRAHMTSTASSFYRWAMHSGHCETNPVEFIDRRKQGLQVSRDPSPTRSLSPAEATAMVNAADRYPVESVRLRTSAIVALLFQVGPRVSEAICNTTLADMYVQDGKRVLHVVQKGGRNHLYPLPPSVCRRIDGYLESRSDIDRLPARLGHTRASVTPLFVTATGKPIQRGDITALVRRVAKLAGLDNPHTVHAHVGRHTWITEARRQGHASDEIRAAVGHASTTTTDRYGKHVLALDRSPVWDVAAAFEPKSDR